jgi:transposase, IS6 family
MINRRVRKYLRLTNDSWRVDETYIKIKSKSCYLYRAVDSEGNTIDFWVSKIEIRNPQKNSSKRL